MILFEMLFVFNNMEMLVMLGERYFYYWMFRMLFIGFFLIDWFEISILEFLV